MRTVEIRLRLFAIFGISWYSFTGFDFLGEDGQDVDEMVISAVDGLNSHTIRLRSDLDLNAGRPARDAGPRPCRHRLGQ
jgi:hypothetical protein